MKLHLEEANRLGYELGMRFTKGKHAFIVDTHTDKPHIHNDIFSIQQRLTLQKSSITFGSQVLQFSNLVILFAWKIVYLLFEKKSKNERIQQTKYEKRDTFRSGIRLAIDEAIDKKPKDLSVLIFMVDAGYEVKRGKHTAFRSKGQQRFIRMRSLGDGYTEDEIRKAIKGNAERKAKELPKKQKLNLLIDIQDKIINKGNVMNGGRPILI